MTRVKKLWLLYNGNELFEFLETKDSIGKIANGSYCDTFSCTDGHYIVMPVDGDVKVYRNSLIKKMIEDETVKINKHKDKIVYLINKIT